MVICPSVIPCTALTLTGTDPAASAVAGRNAGGGATGIDAATLLRTATIGVVSVTARSGDGPSPKLDVEWFAETGA